MAVQCGSVCGKDKAAVLNVTVQLWNDVATSSYLEDMVTIWRKAIIPWPVTVWLMQMAW
jgi:hypothetical protein